MLSERGFILHLYLWQGEESFVGNLVSPMSSGLPFVRGFETEAGSVPITALSQCISVLHQQELNQMLFCDSTNEITPDSPYGDSDHLFLSLLFLKSKFLVLNVICVGKGLVKSKDTS